MKFGKSKIFLLFCLSFMLGVSLGKHLNYFIMASTAMIFIAIISIGWANKKAVTVGFLGLALLAGSLRYSTSFPYGKQNFIGSLFSQKVVLEGIIVREPDVRSNKTNLTIKPKGYVGNVLLVVGKYPEYQYGDLLKVTGKLAEPGESEDFSYKNYLSRYDTYGIINYPHIEKIQTGQGNWAKATLLKLKAKFLQVLQDALPEPHNALIAGLILGLKRSLPQDLANTLVIAGVSHIIVISGYNISIITRSILRTKTFLGRKVAFWASLFFVLAFVVMTGAEASVVRAAVMGMMLVFAMNIGRLYNPVNAIVFVGTVMVAQNPKILSFDIGFQLSFLATLGLLYIAPIFEKWLQGLPDILGFRSNLASTLSAQAATLPLLIFYFDRLSLIAPLVNVLILWMVPYAMFFGFLTGVLGLIFLPMARAAAWLLWGILQYLISVVEFFSRLPYAAVSAKINIWEMGVYFALLVLWVAWYRKKKEFNYYLEYVIRKI